VLEHCLGSILAKHEVSTNRACIVKTAWTLATSLQGLPHGLTGQYRLHVELLWVLTHHKVSPNLFLWVRAVESASALQARPFVYIEPNHMLHTTHWDSLQPFQTRLATDVHVAFV
jgi:hypothetical protein